MDVFSFKSSKNRDVVIVSGRLECIIYCQEDKYFDADIDGVTIRFQNFKTTKMHDKFASEVTVDNGRVFDAFGFNRAKVADVTVMYMPLKLKGDDCVRNYAIKLITEGIFTYKESNRYYNFVVGHVKYVNNTPFGTQCKLTIKDGDRIRHIKVSWFKNQLAATECIPEIRSREYVVCKCQSRKGHFQGFDVFNAFHVTRVTKVLTKEEIAKKYGLKIEEKNEKES